MSMMRCEVGDHEFDTDYKEVRTLEDDVICCEDCYNKAGEKDGN